MLNLPNLVELVQNVALLLALVVVSDLLPVQKNRLSRGWQVVAGLLIGLAGLAVMLTPVQYADGVIFDARSILLSLTGLFFGPLPTLLAVLITGALRLYEGGVGAPMGLAVILTSAGLGLAWRWLRRTAQREPTWLEFYGFGWVVHLGMLACTLVLPANLAWTLFLQIFIPVLVIYPLGSLCLGLLLTRQRQRDQLSQALSESEERLEMVLSGSQLGYWDWNLETGRVQRNARWAEMLGYTLAEIELNVKQWTDLHHPEDSAAAQQSIQDHLQGLTPMHRCEYRMRTKDGQYRWILDQARVVRRAADGQPLRMSGTHTDITERKLAEENLRRRTREAEILSQAAAVLTSSLNLPQVLENLLDQLAQVLEYDSATVFLLRDQQLFGMAGRGLPHPEQVLGQQFPTGNKLFQEMAETGRPVIRADVQIDSGFQAWGGTDQIHGWMGIPLIVQGELIGRLSIDSRQVNAYDEMQANLAQAFANQAAIAIYNARLYEQSQVEIAERLQAEQALRQSEALLAEAQRIGQVGHAEWLTASDELVCSAELLRIFDLPPQPQTLPRRALGTRIHPEDRPRLTELDHQAFAARAGFEYEYRILLPDGQVRWIHQQAQVSYTEAGAPLRMMAVFHEITARREAENHLLQRSEELNLLNQVGRELSASLSSEMTVAAALNGLVRAIRPDQAYLFLREDQALVLKEARVRTPENEFIPLETHRVGECLCGRAASENRSFYSRDIYVDWRCTWQECKKAGLKSFAALPLRSGNQVFGVIGLAALTERDFEQQSEFLETLVSQISAALENARLYEAVRGYTAELEARVEARTQELREAQEKLVRHERLAVLGQLAGGVGHELRNPLSVINNALYFLRLTQPEAPEKVREYLGIIAAETQTADKIINDLLEFSRIKAVDLEQVSLTDLVARTLGRYPIPETVQLTLNLPEDLPKAYVDPQQMTQVLGNLVLNACQAMTSGLSADATNGGELILSAAPAAEAGYLLLTVRDTGPGITPENLKKLFEPLFTTKAKGIGLGLAVSQKLVEANGGKITVESELGTGTTFTIWLPVHSQE